MANLFFSRKRFVPKEHPGKNKKLIFVLFVLSLLVFILARTIPLRESDSLRIEMIEASKIMMKASKVLKECQRQKGLSIDKEIDPNQTGLIGLKFSPLTTSLGSLEAKRTTTNPNFAALVVLLLKEAGVREGETVAVGASSSFPALIVAVLSAAKTMNLRPLIICSLGASQWGANNPDFHWLRMQECLLEAGVFDVKPIALSLGGDKDTGEDMSSEGRTSLIKEIKKSEILFIHEEDLVQNVKAKMQLYKEEAGRNRIKAFINIGGSRSSMGTDSLILKLKPGLAKIHRLPPIERRGILYAIAAQKTPVIHLLYIKGLVGRYGLPWDPTPLPHPGEGKIYQLALQKQTTFILLTALYLFLVILACILRI